MSSTHRADGATLRCGHCKIYYCSKTCQTKNWKIHKRVCSTDPALRPYIPVEMTVERVLAKQPTVQAPKDAFCYQGALGLEMDRRFWRRYRSSQDLHLRFKSTRILVTCLGFDGEVDAASQLLDEASTWVGNNKKPLLELKLADKKRPEARGPRASASRVT